MSKVPAAWDVYSKQMFQLSLGWPLWDPEPESVNKPWEIGSVIYPAPQGRYSILLNTTKAESDFVDGELPRGYEPFVPPNLYGPRMTIQNSVLHSKTMSKVEIAAEVGAGDPMSQISASVGIRFNNEQDTGAILALKPPAVMRYVPSKRRIVTYMRKHFDSWLEIVEKKDLEATHDQLYFISGTTKTTQWSTATFTCQTDMSREGHIQCDIAGLGKINLSLKIANKEIASDLKLSGPVHGTERTQTVISDVNDETLQEGCQCIFIHYYKMKRRFLWTRPIRAAAGPHNLPSAGEEPHGPPVLATEPGSDDSDIERTSNLIPKFDPVNELLDYILETTDAQDAVGTDRDLTALFPNGLPPDLYYALMELQPPIDIDEDGVATVDVDVRYPEVYGEQTAVEALPATVGGEASAVGPQDIAAPEGAAASEAEESQPVAGSSLPPGGDGGEDEGLTEEEAARRRLQKRPVVWEPAANGHTGSVTSLAASPNSMYIASGSDDTTIILWDTEDGSVVRKWESGVDTVWHLSFSPDSERLACAGNEGRIIIWDVELGDELGMLEGHTEAVHTVMWSPDGTKLASGSDDMTVRVWNAEKYEQIHLLEGHDSMVTFIAFSPNGKMLASGGAGFNCRIWDVESGALKYNLSGHEGMVWTAAFDPNGRRIATASDDGSVRIWSVESGEELVTLREHQGPVWVVAFTEDGKQIMSASSDGLVKLCDSFSGEVIHALEGHDIMVNSAQFSPDGKFIASASSDNTVRLWNRREGTNAVTFNEHNDKVTHVVFSPDGRTLSSGSDDGKVRIRVLSEYLPMGGGDSEE